MFDGLKLDIRQRNNESVDTLQTPREPVDASDTGASCGYT
jgi:hypothetical protein